MKKVKTLVPMVVYTPNQAHKDRARALKDARPAGEHGHVADFWQHHAYHG